MADRYQDRQFSADGHGRGGDPSARTDAGDPLAELARLIGQTDPFGQSGRPAPRTPSAQRLPAPTPFEDEPIEDAPPSGPPSWMQRANRREVPQSQQREHPPVQNYAGGQSGYASRQHNSYEPEADSRSYQQPAFQRQDAPQGDDSSAVGGHQAYNIPAFGEQEFANEFAKLDFGVTPAQHGGGQQLVPTEAGYQQQPMHDEPESDPSRYDEALYGQIAPAPQYQEEQGFQGEQYSYDNYDDAQETAPKRRGGMMAVIAILAVAFLGTGGAYAYKTFFSRSRGGEPPIIRADNSPTKIMSASDSNPKVPDRLIGDGSEKMVSREETPVDVNTRSVGPRVVFPPLNPNSNPPLATSVSPGQMPLVTANASNGTLPNSDPRPVRTVSIGGDQANPPGAKPVAGARTAAPIVAPPAATRPSPANANASANAPLSLSPQTAPAAPAGRVAALPPDQAPASAASGGGYLVSISSQDSEAGAQTSFKSMQSKYPSALGSRTPVIKRVTDKNGKVNYRAAIGPFASYDEAVQMCKTYAGQGGQCFAFKN